MSIILKLLVIYSISWNILAADIYIHEKDTIKSIIINGTIEQDDDLKFIELIQNNDDMLVFIISPRGNVETAMRIGLYIRQYKMDTLAGPMCYSSCTIILASGINRTAMEESKIGMHRPVIETDGFLSSINVFLHLLFTSSQTIYIAGLTDASRISSYFIMMGVEPLLATGHLMIPNKSILEKPNTFWREHNLITEIKSP